MLVQSSSEKEIQNSIIRNRSGQKVSQHNQRIQNNFDNIEQLVGGNAELSYMLNKISQMEVESESILTLLQQSQCSVYQMRSLISKKLYSQTITNLLKLMHKLLNTLLNTSITVQNIDQQLEEKSKQFQKVLYDEKPRSPWLDLKEPKRQFKQVQKYDLRNEDNSPSPFQENYTNYSQKSLKSPSIRKDSQDIHKAPKRKKSIYPKKLHFNIITNENY